MLYAKNDDDQTVRPHHTGERAKCPSCESTMVAHVGTRVIAYWSHASLDDCDSWAEPDNSWHLGWQEQVDLNYGRREVSMTVKGVRHRADIIAESGTITEVQHSGITADDIKEREEFYGHMIWIWDTCRAYSEGRLCLTGEAMLLEGSWREFTWKSARVSLLDCEKPVFLDLGNGWLMRVANFVRELPVRGAGTLVSFEQMVRWITYGPPLSRPAQPCLSPCGVPLTACNLINGDTVHEDCRCFYRHCSTPLLAVLDWRRKICARCWGDPTHDASRVKLRKDEHAGSHATE